MLCLPRIARFALVIALCCSSPRLVSPCGAQTNDALPERLPGLVAAFKTADGSAIRRTDQTLQQRWATAAEFDQRLVGSDTLSVTWTGWLDTRTAGQYKFSIYGSGSFTLSLADQVLIRGDTSEPKWFSSQALELPFGLQAIKLDYRSTDSAGSKSSGSKSAGEVRLYWEGPGFQLEPITERYLVHQSSETGDDAFERGRALAHGLRCVACHQSPSGQNALPGPALTALNGNLNREWLVNWLTSASNRENAKPNDSASDDPLRDDEVTRRMPHIGLSPQDAADIAAALFSASQKLSTEKPPKSTEEKTGEKEVKGKSKTPRRTQPDASQGAVAFSTRGCLACHSVASQEIGLRDPDDDTSYLPHARQQYLMHQLFGGGDLSRVGEKRPQHFFARWLAEPQRINAAHRMPLTELSALEREDIALYLSSPSTANPSSKAEPDSKKSDSKEPASKESASKESTQERQAKGDAQRGHTLLTQHRCVACHTLPTSIKAEQPKLTVLTANSQWESGCLTTADSKNFRPGFELSSGQRRALKTYWTSFKATAPQTDRPSESQPQPLPAELVMAERNCLSCHARHATQGLAPAATAMVGLNRDLAARLPALLPPSLTGVGDKLHDQALAAAIARQGEPHRPWLEVRMPKYQLPPAELSTLVSHLVSRDRIPDLPAKPNEALADDVVTRAAAGRLVTSDGFGCQSCHQIGKQPPPTVALNARGTDLTMMGQRIRRTWFDRWVRNPVRIVPRMEMPAIQLPVHGVLGNDLSRQLDAVWEMLNTPGFQPPTPAPVRVVRGHNQAGVSEPAYVLTDVLETPERNYLRPFIVGFQNRQNMLIDFERAELSRWWIGDTARELTRGKSWYWELGGQPLAGQLESLLKIAVLDSAGQRWDTKALEQFAIEFDQLEHTSSGLVWRGRWHIARQTDRRTIPIQMQMEPDESGQSSGQTSGQSTRPKGFTCDLAVDLPDGYGLLLELDSRSDVDKDGPVQNGLRVKLDARSELVISSDSATISRWKDQPLIALAKSSAARTQVKLRFQTEWPVDEIRRASDTPSGTGSAPSLANGTGLTGGTAPAPQEPRPIKVVPGFDGLQLPLPRDEMPTALSWHRGELVIGSLKGRVCIAHDTNGDGLADTWEAISDDVPAPYGVFGHDEGVDVLAKYGLLRLTKTSVAGAPWKLTTVADGWGYTADYHDWAVGLPRDQTGNYFVALPCQQDDRTPSAARLRGSIQKLIPTTPTSDNPRLYRLETFAAGQRFPMGLAFDRQGRLFATDNQGNYNPFNELNHIQAGKRYGFINKLENQPGFNPPLESPAVNLPHPWTRSVNGICFLNTPTTASKPNRFGPFEGHLIGCEYNGLSLIRMSLQEVDGVMQGAAYLFSRPPQPDEPTFEGPVVCAVAPEGDVYVGNIHDSGWGG
ncbi:MAG: c-type cytochrome, partial [Pirellulaceae bacterium]|nr:c-type cytochrome [Pirellulaceae bacterium]